MYFSKQGANKGQCPPPVVVCSIFMSSYKSILLEHLSKTDLHSPSNKTHCFSAPFLMQGTDMNTAQGQHFIHCETQFCSGTAQQHLRAPAKPPEGTKAPFPLSVPAAQPRSQPSGWQHPAPRCRGCELSAAGTAPQHHLQLRPDALCQLSRDRDHEQTQPVVWAKPGLRLP